MKKSGKIWEAHRDDFPGRLISATSHNLGRTSSWKQAIDTSIHLKISVENQLSQLSKNAPKGNLPSTKSLSHFGIRTYRMSPPFPNI